VAGGCAIVTGANAPLSFRSTRSVPSDPEAFLPIPWRRTLTSSVTVTPTSQLHVPDQHDLVSSTPAWRLDSCDSAALPLCQAIRRHPPGFSQRCDVRRATRGASPLIPDPCGPVLIQSGIVFGPVVLDCTTGGTVCQQRMHKGRQTSRHPWMPPRGPWRHLNHMEYSRCQLGTG